MQKTSLEMSVLIWQYNAISEKLENEYQDLDRLSPQERRDYKALCLEKQRLKIQIEHLGIQGAFII